MGDFIRANGGRLLVMAAFVTLLVFAHHSAGIPAEKDFAAFCTSKAGEAFSAFLALVTGHLLAGGNGNGNGKKNSNGADPNHSAPVEPGH